MSITLTYKEIRKWLEKAIENEGTEELQEKLGDLVEARDEINTRYKSSTTPVEQEQYRELLKVINKLIESRRNKIQRIRKKIKPEEYKKIRQDLVTPKLKERYLSVVKKNYGGLKYMKEDKSKSNSDYLALVEKYRKILRVYGLDGNFKYSSGMKGGKKNTLGACREKGDKGCIDCEYFDAPKDVLKKYGDFERKRKGGCCPCKGQCKCGGKRKVKKVKKAGVVGTTSASVSSRSNDGRKQVTMAKVGGELVGGKKRKTKSKVGGKKRAIPARLKQWIAHVKAFAKKKGIKYNEALKHKDVKKGF